MNIEEAIITHFFNKHTFTVSYLNEKAGTAITDDDMDALCRPERVDARFGLYCEQCAWVGWWSKGAHLFRTVDGEEGQYCPRCEKWVAAERWEAGPMHYRMTDVWKAEHEATLEAARQARIDALWERFPRGYTLELSPCEDSIYSFSLGVVEPIFEGNPWYWRAGPFNDFGSGSADSLAEAQAAAIEAALDLFGAWSRKLRGSVEG